LINKPESYYKLGFFHISKHILKVKLGGLIAIDNLSHVIQEADIITFLNKFLSPVFQQFTFVEDVPVLKRVAVVFGKLLRMGGLFSFNKIY